MAASPETLLSHQGLVVTAALRPNAYSFNRHAEWWFDCVMDVSSPPFSGKVAAIFTAEDLRRFADALEAISPEGTAVLGGDRAAELRLDFKKQVGGRAGALALRCSLCPSGDDPWPRLEFLLFDVEPSFCSATAARARALCPEPPTTVFSPR